MSTPGVMKLREGSMTALMRVQESVPAGEGDAGVVLGHGVEHAVLLGDLPAGVRDDGVAEVGEAVVRLDVADPALVVLHRVARQRDHLHPALGKLPAKRGSVNKYKVKQAKTTLEA